MAKFVVKINGEPKFEVEEFVERVRVLSPKGEMGALNCGDDPLLNEINIQLIVPDGLNPRLGDNGVNAARENRGPTSATLRAVNPETEALDSVEPQNDGGEADKIKPELPSL